MKNYFSAKELEELHLTTLPSCKRLINIKATNENWPFRARKGKGGGREYNIDDLPSEVRAELLSLQQKNKESKAQEEREAAMASLLKLQDSQLQKASIREQIVQEYLLFKESSGLSNTKARMEFCLNFNNKKILPDSSVRAVVSNICERTLFNLQKNYETMGLAGLADNYGNRKGASKIEARPELKELILGLIYYNPDISSKLIMRALRTKFGWDNVPSYKTIRNWVLKWKNENESLLLAIKNPDAWRNKFQAAAGSQSEKIVRLNQRWEFDSTPTDIMLDDGSRHNIVGVIDVYSRRLKLLVSNSSNSKAVTSITRACLLEWGVPEEVKTDNGADYASKHMRRVFDSLEIKQIFCKPFIRELKTFTLRDIENKVKVKNSTIFSYLKALEKAQILNKEVIYKKEKGCLRTNVYTLVKDMGAMAPVVNKNGCLVEDSHQARIWRAIRILKNFTLKDIVATASQDNDPVSLTTTDQYLNYLKKAGYLIKKNNEKIFHLNPAMNKGIQAPQIQRIKQIYDPNIDAVVWNSEEA